MRESGGRGCLEEGIENDIVNPDDYGNNASSWWLASKSGDAWLRTDDGVEFLDTEIGLRWLHHTATAAHWLQEFKTPGGEGRKSGLDQMVKFVSGRRKPEEVVSGKENRRNDDRVEPVTAPEYLTDCKPPKDILVNFKPSVWKRIGVKDPFPIVEATGGEQSTEEVAVDMGASG